MRIAAAVLLWGVLAGPAAGQSTEPVEQRTVSWKRLIPNIASDQKHIWLFPLKLGRTDHWAPTVSVVSVTAGLVATDPISAPYFRRASSFDGFNSVFSGGNTNKGIIAVPAALYAIGLLRKDSKMQRTALLAGEAVADAEILTTVMKDASRRLRPADIPVNGDFSDSWFRSRGPVLRGRGSTPSGHTIAAISVATVFARSYGKRHKWVPWVAYGVAGLVGFSRVSLSSHFVSDVVLGGVLGYSISRFTVLRQ